MNRARKLIAFIRDHANQVLGILHQSEPTTGDLQGAAQMLVTMRGDLEELEERVRGELDRRRQKPSPLVPAREAIADREYATDTQHVRVQSCCPPAGAQHASPAPVPPTVHEHVSPFAGVERPVRPVLDVSDRPRLALGRYRLVDSRLIAMSGTISSPGRKAV